MRGKFLTFEGPEGAGKSTQVSLLADRLRKQNIPVLCTREPGGTQIGEEIRRLLLDTKYSGMADDTELFLYMAARAQLFHEKIRPALEAGSYVICDRYIDSNIAYQGCGRKLGMERVKRLNESISGQIYPDITFFLDVSPEEGLLRKAIQGQKKDRIEEQDLIFHRRVYEGFQKLLQDNPERIVRLDALQSPEKLHQQIVSHLFFS